MSDIRVAVETRYIEKESDPAAKQFVFAYTITITNAGDAPAQLLNRHWYITDANGEVKEVEGPGVVGKQPRLTPGQAFRYTSACVLPTPYGTMHGEYEFRRDDDARFMAPIDPFVLVLPSMVH
ncbi:MAG: Co2+/Mg2+ efflux protein ApaG [Gammaproteobacteria bacterium]